jgi:hypothetical protein
MPPTDLVPCFYAGQHRWSSPPAKLLSRAALHIQKALKLGQFVDNGRAFQFSKLHTQNVCATFDGPLGIGNLLPFARMKNLGEKLHYECAMAGDGNWVDGYTPRRLWSYSVSNRSKFNLQSIPAVPIRALA